MSEECDWMKRRIRVIAEYQIPYIEFMWRQEPERADHWAEEKEKALTALIEHVDAYADCVCKHVKTCSSSKTVR